MAEEMLVGDQVDVLELLRSCFPGLAAKHRLACRVSQIANLWAGMGAVLKVVGGEPSDLPCAVIIKRIVFPSTSEDKLSVGDIRKIASYDVEAVWYELFSSQFIESAHYNIVPRCLFVDRSLRASGQLSICMTELPGSCPRVMSDEMAFSAVLGIARLHATWWGRAAANSAVVNGLQTQGGYWYLGTRWDEWEAIPRSGWYCRLKKAASAIDRRLQLDLTQCIIHGDLKPSNMSFERRLDGILRASFCDFQYVGMASPMKDLAYFFTVTVEDATEEKLNDLLVFYRAELCRILIDLKKDCEVPSIEELVSLLTLAYADLCRWMAGWGYFGDEAALKTRTKKLLDEIDGGVELANSDDYFEALLIRFPISKVNLAHDT